MKNATAITCVFLDIGGVLLTNGWDHHARKRAATNFKRELDEMEDRHHLTFDTYEEGKLTREEYLGRVVFYQRRPFTRGCGSDISFLPPSGFPPGTSRGGIRRCAWRWKAPGRFPRVRGTSPCRPGRTVR